MLHGGVPAVINHGATLELANPDVFGDAPQQKPLPFV